MALMKRTLILVALLLRVLLLSAHEDKLTEGYWQIAGNHGLAVSNHGAFENETNLYLEKQDITDPAQADGSIVIEPLIPEGEWDWFSLSRISCAGKEISVIYDRTGEHYGCKPGLTVYVDGKKVAHSETYSTKIAL